MIPTVVAVHDAVRIEVETKRGDAAGGWCCKDFTAFNAAGEKLTVFKVFGPKAGIPVVFTTED